MGRFMYVHFGDDVPRNIEKEYNKLLRKERYIEELDAKNRSCEYSHKRGRRKGADQAPEQA